MSTTSNTLFSQQTGHKYTFQLELKKLYVNPSLPFQAKIIWARGQQRIQSQNPIKFQPPQSQVTLQQCFCNKSTVLFNSKKKEFRKKQSKIQIILYANGSPKQGGEYLINLCEILDPFDIKKQQVKMYRVVTRQQKPRCQIQFQLTATYCQQMLRDEQKSIGSGVGSISSKNTTSIMTSDQKNYVQKKNLFLYEPPSKDNQSVVSYTSYTGMARYNSNRKQRDDSSVKKQDYGIPIPISKRQNTTSNDFFNKTTNMKSNISQEYDIKSRTGAYNRYTQPPFDNKTQNFEQNSNKILLDEQSKRSKLEAQVMRLNIYMKQQSNKLSQYIVQNTRLKQQLNKLSSQNHSVSSTKNELLIRQHEQDLNKMKRENDDLHNKAFDLNNQNRELHRKLDAIIGQKQRIQQEMRRMKLEKQRAETKFDSLNRNMEGIISTKQMMSKDVQNLKDQLQHIKSLNMNLRENLQKQRRKNQQLQYTNQYQLSNISDDHKKKQQRFYEIQRQNSSLLSQLRELQRQMQNKKQILYRLQRTNDEYKNKIVQNQSEKNFLFDENKVMKLENQKMKGQLAGLNETILKMRDEKNNSIENQQKSRSLQSANYQYLQKIRTLEYEVEQGKKNYGQILTLNDTIKRDLDDKKNQIYRLETNLKGLKDMENKFYTVDKLYNDRQRELSYARQETNKLKSQMSQLQQSYRKLTVQLQQTKRKVKQNPHSKVDVNQILRQSVQMQVQLKFKTDQLIRLKSIQQKFQQYKYRLQIEQRNRHQIQQENQRIQKELKDKNKMYLIEVEKGKLTLKQKLEMEKEFQNVRNELRHCQEIIYNGDKQVKDMEGHIQRIESQNRGLVERLGGLEQELMNVRVKAADTSKFESRIKEIEKDLGEKSYTVNVLTSNLSTAQNKISQLEQVIKYKESEIEGIKRSQHNAIHRLKEFEQTKLAVQNELHRLSSQKKAVQVKCQLIMQQLHSLKKSFQEQKGRSTSIVSIRSSQQQAKIRQLQNDLQKKDKLISKLSKQKLEIEEQNINLHVQVMKKLSQMEKNKDSMQTPSSQKFMVTPK